MQAKKVWKRIVEILFVISFILTGCGIDSIFESTSAAVTWVLALITTVLCAMAMGGNDDHK